jgi:hypothetical protein
MAKPELKDIEFVQKLYARRFVDTKVRLEKKASSPELDDHMIAIISTRGPKFAWAGVVTASANGNKWDVRVICIHDGRSEVDKDEENVTPVQVAVTVTNRMGEASEKVTKEIEVIE